MHILLTDVLSCPRCGPGFGLIVLADAIDDRLVLEGRLGCANCRDEYPIAGGVADLRTGSRAAVSEPGSAPAVPPSAFQERAFRTAALLGVGSGGGIVLVRGGDPEMVDEVDRLLPNAHVVGGGGVRPERSAGAGWLLLDGALPFREASLRGVALLNGAPPELLPDASRALAPGARLVIDPAPPNSAHLLAESGLTVLLEQEGVVVAAASPAR